MAPASMGPPRICTPSLTPYPVHHQLRLHGSRRQCSARRRRLPGDDTLNSRNPRLHAQDPRPVRKHRNTHPDWLPAMKMAAQVANDCNKPWVLDPVAAGASGFRLNACLELLKLRPSVVRGNGSEIMALFKGSSDENSKACYYGVDSLHDSTDAVEAAKSLAQITGSVVAITATGCSVTALIAAFVAVDPLRPFEATATALSVFGLAAEIGMEMAKGPASLRMHLIDTLHGLDQDIVHRRVNISHM
ncbi:UNVERIFIED_CONTAM: Hydroxyethylthiazole kinase [Sesamum radiatum]|uniref:hydroxyethylthiazole kinase n=1 Tax=Sesamum radiatum TaxID=300843 RepID=A0AAW2S7F0_SESRA